MESDGSLDVDDYAQANSEEPEPGALLFPKLEGNVQLREYWYMQRRHRPMVPAPSRSPMPDKQDCKSKKARLFSLYLRPWVLDRRWATQEVPSITGFDLFHFLDSEPKTSTLALQSLRTGE